MRFFPARSVVAGTMGVVIATLGGCGAAFSGGGDPDGGTDATFDTSVDGGPGDGRGDGGGGDGGHEFDVQMPDVFEEAPSSCGAGFACVPAQPPGWQDSNGWNLYEVYPAGFPGDGGGPGCDPNFAFVADLNAEFSDAGAQCHCACDPPADPCPLTPLQSHDNSGCNDLPCDTTPVANGVCTLLNPTCVATMSALELDSPTPAGCTPNASTVLPAPFGETLRTCVSQVTPGSSSCEAGTVCQPAPSSAFAPKLCLMSMGDKSCPPQDYNQRRTLYGSYTEGRTCSSCTCGPGMQQCSAQMDLYDTCAQGTHYGQFAPGCAQVNSAQFAVVVAALSTGTPACSASGGAPQGQVTPSNAFTLCCMP
jgi:hypothetical protein